MRRIEGTSPSSPAGTARREAGAVRPGGEILRELALHREPRPLPRRSAHPRRGAALDGAAATAPPVGAPSAEELAATRYQDGYRAGFADAEAAAAAAQQRAVDGGYVAGFERGAAEGREQGRAEGALEARAAVEREAAARLARLDHLLASLPEELRRRLDAAEDEMVALCHAVVCRILGEELVRREGVAACVRQAVREATGAAAVDGGATAALALHLHPRDLAALQADGGLAAWLAGRAAQVRFVGDDRVQLGGCLVRVGGEGILDARLETQLASLRALLLARPAVEDAGGELGPGAPAPLGATSPQAREHAP